MVQLCACEPEQSTTPLRASVRPAGPCVGGEQAFVDASADTGWDVVHSIDARDLLSAKHAFDAEMTAGVAATDLEGDGGLDLVFTQHRGPLVVAFDDGGGRFQRLEGPEGPFDFALPWDGDDQPGTEVLLAARGRLSRLVVEPGRVLRLDPLERWAVPGWPGALASSDWDHDGDLDLYVGGYLQGIRDGSPFRPVAGPDRLLRFDAPGATPALTDVTAERPISDDGATLFARFVDVDDDGDEDLIEAHDFGSVVPSRIWTHGGVDERGRVRWIAAEDGSTLSVDAPMGLAVDDFDADGFDDLLFSNLGKPVAFRGSGGTEFVDVQLAWLGTVPDPAGDASWSVLPIDVDADSRLDVLLTYGPLPAVHGTTDPPPISFHNRLLRNVDDDHGELDLRYDSAALPEHPPQWYRGAAVGDWNDDAVTDVVITAVGGSPLLWLGTCPAGGRLRVDLHGAHPLNPRAVGATVRVTTDGGVQRRRVVGSGPGTFSGGGGPLVFGLGEVPRATVEVQWPGGAVTTIEDVGANSILVVQQP